MQIKKSFESLKYPSLPTPSPVSGLRGERKEKREVLGRAGMQLALLAVFLGDSCTFFFLHSDQSPPCLHHHYFPLPPAKKKNLCSRKVLGLCFKALPTSPWPPNGGMGPGYNSHTLATLYTDSELSLPERCFFLREFWLKQWEEMTYTSPYIKWGRGLKLKPAEICLFMRPLTTKYNNCL